MLTKQQSSKLRGLITRHVQAKAYAEMAGCLDPETAAEVRENAKKSADRLWFYIRSLTSKEANNG